MKYFDTIEIFKGKKNEIAINSVQLVNNPDRSLIKQMLHMNEFIDLMIPRGGTNLVNFVSKNAKMNSITGGIGVCHIYVDKDADLEKALNVVTNAKVQRYTVCNAIDTVIVHEEIASSFIPDFIKKMSEYNVEIRADKKTFAYFETNQENIIQANNKDFGQEFLDLTVHEQDHIVCGGANLQTISFKLVNARGHVVNLNGAHMSFTLLFQEYQ